MSSSIPSIDLSQKIELSAEARQRAETKTTTENLLGQFSVLVFLPIEEFAILKS